MQRWIFSIITPVFSVTWSFRNHSNMLIWCSRNIWLIFKSVMLLNIFFVDTKIHFLGCFDEWNSVFEIEIFCNIINVFSVTFSEFNASLLKKTNNLIKKTMNLYKCYSNIWLQFVSGAKEICFTLWRGGYWADFINPLSGKAVSTFISVQTDEQFMYIRP